MMLSCFCYRIIFCFIILCCINEESNASPTVSLCSPAQAARTSTTFVTNLNSLLSLMSSNSNNSDDGFYNTTIGQEPDRIYGLYACRGDVTSHDCHSCVLDLTTKVFQNCTNHVGAVAMSDFCMLRYSNASFFSVADLEPTFVLYNSKKISQPDLSDINAWYLLQQLIRVVPKSPLMFGVDNITRGSERRYGLAQCMRDISVDDCTKCLNVSIANMAPKCCEGKLGWRIATPSCYFRYEAYLFYGRNSTQDIPQLDQGTTGGKSRIVIIATTTATVFTLIVSFGWCIYYKKIKNKKGEILVTNQERPAVPSSEISTEFLQSFHVQHSGNIDLPIIPLYIIKTITGNFSDECKHGEGGFGPVYKAMLPDGKEVAIKRLSEISSQGLDEFKNEAILIAKLQHRNLVRLLGYCVEQGEKLLVYEFMPNGSLDLHLFGKKKDAHLNWQRRLSIINGVAKGLMYLHEDSRLRVIHRDLKASNILLDHEMNPKISDFGLAKIFASDQRQGNTKRVVGTFGYMAPEYAMEGIFSVKSDVYSFGVVLLEIIAGKPTPGFYISKNGLTLPTYAWRLWNEGKASKIIDLVVEKSGISDEVMKCIQIALLCVQEDAADRPAMSNVVVMLASDTTNLPTPKKPAFFIERMVMDQPTTSSSSKVCSIYDLTMSTVSDR